MTRIVAGRAGGRRLAVPTKGTRPTSERVREALFSAVGHRLGGWEGTSVVDVYAGSGALGLEAWSRGAESVVAVERDRKAAGVVAANVAAVGARADVTVLVADASALPSRAEAAASRRPADVVFLDPPYRFDDAVIGQALTTLVAGDWLAQGCLAVLERPSQASWRWPPGWESVTDRRYGDTRIWQGVLVASEAPSA